VAVWLCEEPKKNKERERRGNTDEKREVKRKEK
jgi:hypothetical protein